MTSRFDMGGENTLKVIHIMNHPPAYEAYANQPRPAINWETPAGTWVGIWGYDWADLLAIEARKIDGRIDHEIWQPDLRADKIYSKEIFPGVVHRIFPACERIKWIGLKKMKMIFSPGMIDFAESENQNLIVFHIGQPVTNSINRGLLETYKTAEFILSFHGQITLPNIKLFKFQKNIFAKVTYLKEHFQNKKLFTNISYLTFQSTWNIEHLNKYYSGPSSKLTMGIHFDDYQRYEKKQCRRDLNLPQKIKILITMSRLNDLKQIDRLIEVLTRIKKDFLFIVVGHGTRKYEDYLKEKAAFLMKNNKICFVGYKTGQEKIKYLNASDLFIHVSKSEAGPVVNMEAMACRLPILTTNTGNTAEFLKENRGGRVVDATKYQQWQVEIENFLDGQEIDLIDFELAKRNYDWQNIAHKFNEIYTTCLQK